MATLVSVAPPAPAPSATPPYPVIYRTKTSPLCNSLQTAILPVGYVAKINDAAIHAMALSTRKFLAGLSPGDLPNSADFNAALNGKSATALTTQMAASGQGDDPLLYSPAQILNASRIDQTAQDLFHNVTVADRYMKESYKEHPIGQDPALDALRQRQENLINLQLALANRYEEFAGTYLGNQGMGRMSVNDAGSLATLKVNARSLILGDTIGLTGVPDGPRGKVGYKNLNELAKNGSTDQIVRELRSQEYSLAPAMVSTFNHCRGTTYHFATPPPAATPTPIPAPTAKP